MNPRQERLLSFVRELHRRDQRGPDAFPIRPSKDSVGIISGRLISLDSPTTGDDLVSLKQVEAFKRGLAPQSSVRPPTPPLAAIQAPLAPALTEQAADAFSRALSNKPLSSSDLIHLESIVLPALRPAFDIQNETYDTLPANWDPFNRQRTAIEPLIRGIGRLQLTGHPTYTLVGTGFVCGPNAILTNRHVAQIFVQGVESGQQLSFLPGVSCAMDMLAEVGSAGTLRLDLTRPIAVSTLWDVALLRIETLPDGVTPLPLAASPPAAISGGFATIIGYPSYDPYESFADQANIFRAVFDRKRFQPGKLNGCTEVPSFGRNVSAVAHDCSTLGGNSGSALISADIAQVVGIHFSGITHLSNYAVPTWELVADPAFAGQSLNFV
jgi:endonuclease G